MKINNKLLLVFVGILVCFLFNITKANAAISVARAFYEMARQNNKQKIESLLHRGYSLESVEENGYTPLCIAISRQDKSAYKTLVSYGANKKPECLKKIPESSYRRFFGVSPTSKTVAKYQSDTPYNIGTAILGGGAIVAAFALKGGTGGGGSNPPSDPEVDPDTPSDPTYNEIEHCIDQQKDKCKKCEEGYILQGNKCILPTECPENSSYNTTTKTCMCDSGYGYYGDDEVCYKSIAYCVSQYKDQCNKCKTDYVLKDNVCYPPIYQCKVQDGNICKECEEGYGIHGGTGEFCYKNIEDCVEQQADKCTKCSPGYGTHGDPSKCYKDVENCIVYNNVDKTLCEECASGYETHGDGLCYIETFCDAYPNTIPQNGECVCDISRGYMGERDSCSQTTEGDYSEGDGNVDEWTNLNERYCSSQGVYHEATGLCECHVGYAGKDCSKCNEDLDASGQRLYLPFDGRCYANIKCDAGENRIQSYSSCVCKEGYLEIDGLCSAEVKCGRGKEQYKAGDDPLEVCRCKENFIEENGECICPTEEIDGIKYSYDALNDVCVIVEKDCSEKNGEKEHWSGANCDICSSQYAITIDEAGVEHCGLECAENRLDIKQNASCELCAEDYVYDDLAATCVFVKCKEGDEGYIIVNNQCLCDEAGGYSLNSVGYCEKKKEDLIGLKDNNINNSTIKLSNIGEHRDVYGMKPVAGVDEAGKEIYYDSVYNSLNHGNSSINIENKYTGKNTIYGIYSPSVIYNSATLGGENNIISHGRISIDDEDSKSNIYGLYSEGNYNVYNSFSFNSSQEKLINQSLGDINIVKSKTDSGVSGGDIVGILGGRNIYNSYAISQNGVGAISTTLGNINITHNGVGNAVGVLSDTSNSKINNAYSYLDSAASKVVAEGNIIVSGNSTVIGIQGNGRIANSETQFSKNYNVIEGLEANGTIDVTSNSSAKGEGAYGILSTDSRGYKADVYNAIGYNTEGKIIAKNINSGTAYGIYSENERYIVLDEEGKAELDEDGNIKYIYNNVYNAFRSSQVYGGENVAAKGSIEVIVSGNSNVHESKAVGIYTPGDAFNAYTKSASDIKLEAEGTIKVTDDTGSSTQSISSRGIEGAGDIVANAYSIGQNQNNSSVTKGIIEIHKSGASQSASMAGIYSEKENKSKGSRIINAGLVNDKNTVEGSIVLTAENAHGRMYGIYAERGGTEGQIKTVYNAYYDNNTEISEGKVTGTISIKTQNYDIGYAGIYGIYVDDGQAHNAYSTNTNADVVGKIEIYAKGGGAGGEIVGMYASGMNSKLFNEGKSSITVESTGSAITGHADTYGMKALSGIIVNDAKISTRNTAGNAHGIYIKEGVATNDKNGIITVSGYKNNYGIYADVLTDASEAKVFNHGTIEVSGNSNNYGIYANIKEGITGSIEVENTGTINLSGSGKNVGIYASGEGVTIKNSNTGKISINNSVCTGASCNNGTAIVLNGATFINEGVLTSDDTIDLTQMNGDIVLAAGGSFVAPASIEGDLGVSSNVIEDVYEKTTSLKNAITSENVENLNLKSKSYMYEASLKQVSSDSYNVDMILKDFNSITTKDKAEYYAQNYNDNNKDFFTALKKQETAKAFASTEAKLTGEHVLANITEEEIKVSRSLDKAMMSELFKESKDDVRQFVGADALFIGRDDVATLTGYELDAQSMYTMYDKKLNNKYRLGAGISFTHTNTDYNNDSSRKNFMVQGYVPLTMTLSDKLTAVSMARLGYQDGEYSRYGYDNKLYQADTSAISYGLLNELRYKIKFNNVNVSPFAGLNIMGWYNHSVDESGDNLAVNMASSHVLSIESALGLYVDMQKEFNDFSKLTTTLGIGYYHEFAKPYDSIKAKIVNTNGSYKLRNRAADSKDRGMLSAKVNYDYKDFSIYGELLQYLEDEYPLKVDVGVRYNF